MEWQIAVDAAEAMLLLDSARQYGLVTGGLFVDVDRCVDLLARGHAAGYVPIEAHVDAVVAAVVSYRP